MASAKMTLENPYLLAADAGAEAADAASDAGAAGATGATTGGAQWIEIDLGSSKTIRKTRMA